MFLKENIGQYFPNLRLGKDIIKRTNKITNLKKEHLDLLKYIILSKSIYYYQKVPLPPSKILSPHSLLQYSKLFVVVDSGIGIVLFVVADAVVITLVERRKQNQQSTSRGGEEKEKERRQRRI